jgi:hypothetical protein
VDDSHFQVTTEGSGLYRVVGAKIEKVRVIMQLLYGPQLPTRLKRNCV